MNTKKRNSKKIVYIEAIIYIFIIIISIFVCNSGNIYIKMFPILFLLGFIGKIVFDRPVVTTIFGMVTSLCVVKLTTDAQLYKIFFVSLCCGLNIALGELFGEYFCKCKKIYKSKKSKNDKKCRKNIFTYVITILVLLISICVHIYTNGNYVSYFKAQNSIKKDLIENYKDETFTICSSSYSFYKIRSYNFKIKHNEKDVTTNFFVLKDKNYAIYDEYKSVLDEQNNIKLNEKLEKFVDDKNINLNNELKFKIETLDSNEQELLIIKNVDNVNNQSINQFVTQVNQFLIEFKNFYCYNNIQKVELSIVDDFDNNKSLISDFYTEDFNNAQNTYDYILNSINIEFID